MFNPSLVAFEVLDYDSLIDSDYRSDYRSTGYCIICLYFDHNYRIYYHNHFQTREVVVPGRVELFSSIEKLVFAITSRILRIRMEHIDSICSSESELFSALYLPLEFSVFLK